MPLPEDTIVAIATPPGRGGIGVVRLSGPRARAIASSLIEEGATLEPRRAMLTRLTAHAGAQGRAIDQAIVTFYQSPSSYTGEDVVEISAHGSPVLLRAILTEAIARGARMAAPGEFTLRAFLNGRIDLVQAEAVNDLIAAATPLQAQAAFDQLDGTLTSCICAIDRMLLDLVARLEASLDFPEEGYRFVGPEEVASAIEAIEGSVRSLVDQGGRGRLLREGMTVAIVGRPNVGKSSLFNRLLGADRAIVTTVPGTTRDLITDVVDINGFAVTFVDTAGMREAADEVEAEGVKRAHGSVEVAAVALVVLDRSEPLEGADRALLDRTKSRARVVVANKSDKPPAWDPSSAAPGGALPVSAVTSQGIEALRTALVEAAGAGTLREAPAVTNIRHLALLERAAASLARGRAAATARAHEELVLVDLHDAKRALEEITGERSADDLLNEIFSRFCIGK